MIEYELVKAHDEGRTTPSTREEILQRLRDLGATWDKDNPPSWDDDDPPIFGDEGGKEPPNEPPTAEGAEEPDELDPKTNGHGDPTTGEMMDMTDPDNPRWAKNPPPENLGNIQNMTKMTKMMWKMFGLKKA